ncbi:ABC-2 type transport system permease protein [Streptacidiphilus sp. MAP12-20]|uniref:ABC transporter permease subunit n=1 Tax=Streptacidiphilus sp. MAP12-20 TaxID=3156299 RepID=UPI0035157EE8
MTGRERAMVDAARRAVHAEYTKLRTVGGTGWLLLATVVLTVGLGAGTARSTVCPVAGCGADAVRLALGGVTLGQAVVAVLGVLAVSGEYSDGMIGLSLAAMPRRTTLLAAKATVLTGAVLAAGSVAVLGSLVARSLILPGNGFTPAHGYHVSLTQSLSDPATLRAAVGSVLYLVLVALLALGVATAVREAATAIGVVLGLLYLFPLLAHVVTDPTWQRHLQQLAPMPAGLAVQATRNLQQLPIGPWAGLGVLAGWTAAALVLGTALLRTRDA